MKKHLIKTPRAITAATNNDLSTKASNIADEISEFLDATSKMGDRSDFLDEYDLEHIGKAQDALYDFAQAYNHGIVR